MSRIIWIIAFFIAVCIITVYSTERKDVGKSGIRDKIIDTAHNYIDVPYKWGGVSKSGVDCSGLVNAVYSENGATLPRSTAAMYSKGKAVDFSKIKPGTLLFFNFEKKGVATVDHVGIYLGDNKLIHSSTSKKKVMIVDLNRFYMEHYVGAREYLD